jgi:hypothetical protein
MVSHNKAFVFVVCGARVYIDTLNLAIQYLRAFSDSRIIVITDSRRNEGAIRCNEIIDVPTDPVYSNHQASIFLKTSVHRYLDLEDSRYCYLDSDILAIQSGAERVFEEDIEVIGFCPDNITLDLFSPYAVHCDCLEKAIHAGKQLDEAQHSYESMIIEWERFKKNTGGDALDLLLGEIRTHKLQHMAPLLGYSIKRYLPFFRNARLMGYCYDKKNQMWRNQRGEVVLFPVKNYYSFVNDKTGYKYDKRNDYWHNGSGHDVRIPQCEHLHHAIEHDHQLNIRPKDWQHWNGGLFVFDKNSVAFLEFWHQETLRIFGEEGWKTRDQGSLATTVWKFGLQQAKCISNQYNYILDYYRPGLGMDAKGGFTRDGFASVQHPVMVHVYHRFGDESWDIWKHLKNIGKEKGIVFDE